MRAKELAGFLNGVVGTISRFVDADDILDIQYTKVSEPNWVVLLYKKDISQIADIEGVTTKVIDEPLPRTRIEGTVDGVKFISYLDREGEANA